MAGKSDFLENLLLNHMLRNTANTPPVTVYVALYSVTPTDAGGGTEVFGGGYARQSVAFDAAAAGATQNTSLITFPQATADWAAGANLVAFGIFDAVTVGNLLYWGALTVAKPVLNGDTAKFPIADIDLSEE